MASPDAHPASPRSSFICGTSHTEELCDEVQRIGWDAEYLAPSRAFHVELSSVQGRSAQLTRGRFEGGVLSRGAGPKGCYVFVISRPEAAPTRLAGEVLVPGSLGLLPSGGEYEIRLGGDDMLLFAVSADVVDREAEVRWGEPLAEGLTARRLDLVDARAGRALADLWSTRLDGDEDGLTSPGSHPASDRLANLPSALLDALGPPGRSRPGPHRRALARQAEAHLRENFRRPLGMNELCRVLDARERTLRDGFLDLYGHSPMAHLKAIRLRAARTSLQTAAPGTRVSDVAFACGFTHLGRFATDYRRAFGQRPSDSLPATRRLR